ncbi:unnamed protein product [Euphydryas editha]|uniref:Uncharacterized protein n=1 Tax=Euphydryas editha TaxID=104508 RepID=A0AAU9U8B4_EUPED|nr:unnamed protein product [Euphydryas editha]
MDSIKQSMADMSQLQVDALADMYDQMEMRGRRKILLVHGVSEEEKDPVKVVSDMNRRFKDIRREDDFKIVKLIVAIKLQYTIGNLPPLWSRDRI